MPKHEFGAYRISSNGQLTSHTASSRTLIVSTHGGRTGSQFQAKGWTHCRFMTPKNGALIADLYEAITGDLDGANLPVVSGNWDDYKLDYYEDDDKSRTIAKYLEDNNVTSVDVFTLRRSGAFHNEGSTTLKSLLTWLETKNFKYPRIDCLFCRVDLNDDTKDFDFVGHQSPTVKVVDEQRFNAQLLINELKSKGKVT
ncbi:MAG: putative adhesin [Acetobacteraceae bacterium]